MSVGAINELVSESALVQLDELYKKLGINRDIMVELINTANKLNNAIADVKTGGDFKTAYEAQAVAMQKVQAAQLTVVSNQREIQVVTQRAIDDTERTRAAEARLATERDQRLQSQIQARAQQEQASSRAAAAEASRVQKQLADEAKLEAQRAKAAATAERAAAATARQSGEYAKLVNAYNVAQLAARNAGAEFGKNSEQFRDAAWSASQLRGQLDSIDRPLGNMQRNVGNYTSAFAGLSKAFGYLRIAAYVLPGIGIAGIFNLIGDGLILLANKVGLFNSKVSQAQETLKGLNEVIKSAGEIYGSSITNLKLLYAATQDITLSEKQRLDAANEMKKLWPEQLDNSTAQAIVNGNEAASIRLITDELLKEAKAEAILGKIKKIEAEKVELQIQKDKINAAKAGEFEEFANTRKNKKAPGFLQGELEGAERRQQDASKRRADFAQKDVNDRIKILDNEEKYLIKLSGNASLAKEIEGKKPRENDLNKGFLSVDQETIKRRIDINQKIIDDDKQSYGKRYNALNNLYADQQLLTHLNEKIALIDANKTSGEVLEIQSKTTTELLKEKDDYLKSKRDLDNKASAQDLDHLKNNLQAQKDAAKTILENPSSTLDNKQKAYESSHDASISLIEAVYQAELKAAGENTKSVKLAQDNKNKSLLQLQTDYLKEGTKILEDEYNKELDGAKKHDVDLLNELKSANAKKLQSISTDTSAEELKLAEKYAKGGMDEEDYQKQILFIQHQGILDSLQAQLDYINQLIALKKKAGHGTGDDEQKAADLQKSIDKENVDYKLKGYKTLAEEKKTLQEAELALLNQSLDVAKSVTDGIIQTQIDRYENQKTLLEQQSNNEKSAVNNSILSAKEKARQTAIIDAHTAAQKAAIDEQIKKAKRKQAVTDKAFNIVSIIENTAVAVSKSLPNIPLSIIVGAIGALQLATVIAQPIPQFYTGTESSPEGFAHVGERGTELMITPSGQMALTPATDTVTWLQKGTEIINHEELIRMMGKPDQLVSSGGGMVDMRAVEQLLKENNNLLRNKNERPIIIHNTNNSEWQSYKENWNR